MDQATRIEELLEECRRLKVANGLLASRLQKRAEEIRDLRDLLKDVLERESAAPAIYGAGLFLLGLVAGLVGNLWLV